MNATDKFFEVACEAGILQNIVNGMIVTGLVDYNNEDSHKAVSVVLQKEFLMNAKVLKAFNDFAREVAYESVIEKLFNAAKKKQRVLNNDPDMFIKILFKG